GSMRASPASAPPPRSSLIRARPIEAFSMRELERAIAIAVEGHSGQVDKAGEPYILHPLRVMLNCATAEERIVGVLHDVVEDCPGWTFERLREEGFSDTVLTALDAVTHREGE